MIYAAHIQLISCTFFVFRLGCFGRVHVHSLVMSLALRYVP